MSSRGGLKTKLPAAKDAKAAEVVPAKVEGARTWRGRVTEKGTGKPIAGAEVLVETVHDVLPPPRGDFEVVATGSFLATDGTPIEPLLATIGSIAALSPCTARARAA